MILYTIENPISGVYFKTPNLDPLADTEDGIPVVKETTKVMTEAYTSGNKHYMETLLRTLYPDSEKLKVIAHDYKTNSYA